MLASLGASVALHLALDHPPRLSLSLDSGQLGGPPPSPLLRNLGRLVSGIPWRLPRRLVGAALLTQFPAYQGDDCAAARADFKRLGVAGITSHLSTQLTHDCYRKFHEIVGTAISLLSLALIDSGQRLRSASRGNLSRLLGRVPGLAVRVPTP